MKLFKSSIVAMPIPGCKECPNRVAKRLKSGSGFYSDWVCAAIDRTNYNHLSKIWKEISHKTHPSVAEQMQCGGFHPDCPLEDYTPQIGDTK